MSSEAVMGAHGPEPYRDADQLIRAIQAIAGQQS